MEELLRHFRAIVGGRREALSHRVIAARAFNHGIRDVAAKLAAGRAAGYITSTGRGRNRRHTLTEAGRRLIKED